MYLIFCTLIYLVFSIPTHRYTCNKNTRLCEQQPIGSTNGYGMSVCRLICDLNASLWPIPTSSSFPEDSVTPIQKEKLSFSHSQNDPNVQLLVDAATQFFVSVLNKTLPSRPGASVYISTKITGNDVDLSLTTDESYSLSINTIDGNKVEVTITAQTFFGMRHGYETLSQLFAYDEVSDSTVIISSAIVQDKPKFPYRGIVLDTSRQFYPVDGIKSLIDAMSYNKLNYFHWHLTDTSSFPFESLAVPNITFYGAFSPDMIYTQNTIKDLVFYAKSRGVAIIPELDAPAHAGNGWNWGPGVGKGNLAVCVNSSPWSEYCLEPPCGQLNPYNDDMYEILGTLYQEMIQVFEKPSFFHMGGDEVQSKCWNASQEIVNILESQNKSRSDLDFLDLWGQFQVKAYNKLMSKDFSMYELNLAAANITPIIWTSSLVNDPKLGPQYVPPSQYIVEVWDYSDTDTVPQLLDKGYSLIIANADALYLDCGYGGWVTSGNNWCSPYKEWQLIYENRPYKSLNGKWIITDPAKLKLLLGEEAAMWSEEVDVQSVDSKIWPRASAMAERLWSDPSSPWQKADDRMQFHRYRMVSRGVKADALQPLWCLQNQGLCTLN